MLTIIKDQQKTLPANGPRDGRSGNDFAAELQAENAGYRDRHEIGVGQRCEFDKPPAAIKVAEDVAGDVKGERGFSDTTWASQGNHAIGGNKISHVSRGYHSTNHACGGRREIVW